MNIPSVSTKKLLEAGVHLGHKNVEMESQNEKVHFGEKIQFT